MRHSNNLRYCDCFALDLFKKRMGIEEDGNPTKGLTSIEGLTH